MGTKNNPGAYDCYANAHPDEPMFILLARDKHAPSLVWLWAMMREIEGEEGDKAKVEEARDCVEDMLQWAVANGRKTVGIGQAALVGVMALVRAANYSVKNAPNQPTRDAELHRMLSRCMFDWDEAPAEKPPEPGAYANSLAEKLRAMGYTVLAPGDFAP